MTEKLFDTFYLHNTIFRAFKYRVFVQLRNPRPLQTQNFPILALFVLDAMLVEFGMHNNSDWTAFIAIMGFDRV